MQSDLLSYRSLLSSVAIEVLTVESFDVLTVIDYFIFAFKMPWKTNLRVSNEILLQIWIIYPCFMWGLGKITGTIWNMFGNVKKTQKTMCYRCNLVQCRKIIFMILPHTFKQLENYGILIMPIVSIQLFIADNNKFTGKYNYMKTGKLFCFNKKISSVKLSY